MYIGLRSFQQRNSQDECFLANVCIGVLGPCWIGWLALAAGCEVFQGAGDG